MRHTPHAHITSSGRPGARLRSRATYAATSLSTLLLVAAAAIPAQTAAATTTPPAVAAGVAATTAQAARFPCLGYGGMNQTNPTSKVMRDEFTWSVFRTVRIGNGAGNINWRTNRYKQPSWYTWMHSLLWLGAPIREGSHPDSGRRTPATLQRAVVVARDWIGDNPYPWPTGPGAGNATMNRTGVLLCLREALVSTGQQAPSWLDGALIQHATFLRDNTWPNHNVGTEQTIAMMGVGCVLGRRDFRDLGADRLASGVTRVIDAQGANNEQSIGYAEWNYNLWLRAERTMTTCGINSPAMATIRARRAGLAAFIDHATTSTGTAHRIGDTKTYRPSTGTPAQKWLASAGKEGAPPRARVKIYSAGYVFGRSGWGTGSRPLVQESAYALHFGPQRVGHGHNDHTSLTWTTRGREILVDPGMGPYVDDAWRTFATGQSGHNQLVVAGTTTSPATRLVASAVGYRGGDCYLMTDSPRSGVKRSRAVLMAADPDIAVVHDAATSAKPTSFTQYWHLPRDQKLSVSRSSATALAPRDTTRTTLIQLPTGSVAAPVFSATRGATRPIQGWYWVDDFHRYPAPVASSTATGRAASFLTVIVADAPNAAVRAVPVRGKAGERTYSVSSGKRSMTFAVTQAGSLYRVR